ncbi:thioesterase family protein [Pararhodobacter sp. SW119]|uniref:acyl-CoA thioesterase n=1 Tax=Pararhodobacter sp. SW119 TaxID=2780075 RepID=UPI001ADFF51C|nr:thioesterase family protein [Pararhodobacter sp. SW119]
MPEPDRLELLRGVVHPWHHDIFGHMNVRHYAPFFDDASFHFYSRLGLNLAEMMAAHGVHMVSAKAETNFLQELKAGDLFVIDGGVARIGNRSMVLKLRMVHAETGAVHATYDLTEVFFDPKTRRSAPMPEAVRARLQAHLMPDG